jgi:S-adenosylmethionine synthetase
MDASHVAEEVLPGHPDRLADAVAEAIVDLAVGRDADALVGVEVAVHRRAVFVTGRIASSPSRIVEWGTVVNHVYARAGVPEAKRPTRVETEVDIDLLQPDERGIRRFSDDQSITVGHATGSLATGYLPAGVHAARVMRDALSQARSACPERLLADGKVLVRLREERGGFAWERCNVSIHHSDGVGFEELHARLLPALTCAAKELDAALPGSAESWSPECVRLNGAGDFSCGGTDGDNGLSGKKLAVDFYGPTVPLGGGAMCGKDPHKVDRVGALRARQIAVRLAQAAAVRDATVWLSWLPGLEAPDSVIAEVDGQWWDEQRVRRTVPVPDLSIDGTFRDLELQHVSWERLLSEGTFGHTRPWER